MASRSFSSGWCLVLGTLLVGFTVGCGGDTVPPLPPNPPARDLPDATRSKVEVDRTADVSANNNDSVTITVTVVTASGAPLADRTVMLEVTGTGNTVTPATGRTNAEGVMTATLRSTVAGSKIITASVEAEGGPVTLGSRPTVVFVLPRAVKLAFRATSLQATAGATISSPALEVELRDATDARAYGATGPVTVALETSPAGGVLEGTLTVNAVNGLASFADLVIKQAGTGYSLKATSPTLTEAISPTFTVVPAGASQISMTGMPASVTAGDLSTVEVTLRDAFGNLATTYTGTVRFTSSDPSAGLPADYTFTATDAGQMTFGGISLKRAGRQELRVTDTVNPLLTVAVSVEVGAGNATKLRFVQQPANRSVRATLAPVQVALVDDFDNVVMDNAPAITLALSPASATLGGTVTVSPVDGVATYSDLVIIDERDGYALIAAAPGMTSTTSVPFNIIDDIFPAKPVLTRGTTTASSVVIQWTAVGDDGNLGNATSQELRYSLGPITPANFGSATLVTTGAPQPPGSAESATISGLMSGTDYFVALRVTDSAGNTTFSDTLSVSTPNPTVTQLAFLAQPVDTTAGSPMPDIRVALQDSTGTTVLSATSDVTLTLVSGPVITPITVAAVSGVATFTGVTINTAGTGYRFEASSSGLPPVQSDPFSIRPGTVASLDLTGLAPPVTSGTAGSVQVTARDAHGNVATGYTGTVRFTSSDGAATLPADYTFVAGDAGQHTFTGVVLRTAGSQTVTVTDTATAALTDTLTVNVNSGVASQLVLTVPAAPVDAGSGFSVTATLRDAAGNVATDYTGTVRFTSSDGAATLPADYTFTPADAGEKLFLGVTLRTSGSQTLTAQDTVAGALTDTELVTVSPGAAASLELSAPTTATAGTSFSVTVTARDTFNNVATGYTGTVRFTSSDGAALLPADYTFLAGDAGSATFSVQLRTAGSRTVTVTDTASAALTATATLTVNPGAPAQLAFTQQPVNGTVRTTLGIVRVSLLDAHGNATTATTPAVTLLLTGGNPSATLSGTLSRTPVAGVATFNDLSVDQEGTGFQLSANAVGVGDATSATFDIVDNIAPDTAVLSGVVSGADSITVSWVAVGDDGNLGTASSYDLRYAATPITNEAEFAAATAVSDLPTPMAPGSAQSKIVTGLTLTMDHHFALKVFDAAGNFSRSASFAVGTGSQDGSVIISEFSALGTELIELHNTTAAPIDVAGYTFRNSAGQVASIRAITDPGGTAGTPVTVPAGGFLSGIANPSGAIPPGTGFVYGAPGTTFALTDTGDVLSLTAAAGGSLQDEVDFSSFVTSPATPLTATHFVGFAGSTTQLDPARLDAADNDNATNWCVSFYGSGVRGARVTNTAGAANGSCGVAVINEAQIDPAGADDQKAFIEIAGPGGSVIGGAKILDIEGRNPGAGTLNTDGDNNPGNPDGEFAIPAGTRIPVDGILLIADANSAGTATTVPGFVAGVDVLAPDMDMENSTGAPPVGETIQLVSAAGSLLDVLGHEPNGALLDVATASNGLAMYETGTARYILPQGASNAVSLSRNTSSTDSDNNTNDFRTDPTPTPGTANDDIVFTVTSLTPDDGPATAGASNASVVGTDFVVGMRIRVASLPDAPCTVNNPTSASCTVIANPGGAVTRVNLTFTNPVAAGSQSVTLTNGFTYTGDVNDKTPVELLEADYCNLQSPATFTATRNTSTPPLYGRIYELGVTEAGDAPAGVIAEVGYGNSGTDPRTTASWRFFSTTWNVQVGNDDEFMGTFTTPNVVASTNFSYTYRFSQDGGLRWTYCDRDGAGSNVGLTFTTAQLGTMTVTP
jgi:hypothetical protein